MIDKSKRLNVVIDSDTHTALKVLVAKKNITISQYVVDALREKMEKEEEKK